MQARPGNQLAGNEPRGPRTLEECLKTLEPLSIARGQLVATDGVCDVRVSVERGQIDLEVLGHELPKGLPGATSGGEAAIVRALVDTAFWDQPLYDVNAGAALAIPDDPKKPRPRIHVARPEAPREVCRAVADELLKLEPTRRRIPSLALTAQATPAAKDAKGGSPVAQKLRAALLAKPTELLLSDWARAESLSFAEVATAFAELLDSNEAKVARKQDPASSGQRAEAALKGGGFCPALRLERAARGLLVKDPARAVAAFVRSGHERLAAGRIGEALEVFQLGCSQDPKAVPDMGIAAAEGLLLALEADAASQRRASGGEARAPGELKRVALELGRAYFALGFMNRARAALERALDDAAPLPYQLELIDALAGAGQLGKALDRAEALAPRLGGSTKRALARKLADNAKGPSLERALALAGVRGQKRTANVAIGVTAIALVVGAGFGAQALAATALAAASKDAKARLEKDGPTPELADPFQAIADRFLFVPAATRAKHTSARLADLAADAKWLRENRAKLAWRSSTDPDAARAQVKAVLEGARTDTLRAGLTEVLAAVERTAQQCKNDIEQVKTGIDANDYVLALDAARRLVETYPGWKDQWKDLRVPLRLVVERPENAIVEWDGERISSPGKNVYLVLLPLGSGSAMLNARGEVGTGWKSDLRKIDLSNASSTIKIALERDPNAPQIRPNGTAGDTQPTTPGGNKNDPKSGKGKISIGGSVGENTPDKGDDPDRASDKRGKFEVREVSGAELQKALGGAAVEVTPSPNYFDFLASELPRDGRLRLAVDVITRVRDRKIFLDAVRLRLEDTVLGHAIPSRDVEIDEPPERPVVVQPSGRRVVQTLDRCVGGAFEQPKFKNQLRNELVGMIRDFNKREGQ